MSDLADETPSENDFGTRRPSGSVTRIIELARATSAARLFYLISSGARKLALRKIGDTAVDYDFRGMNVRFRPNGNTAEKRALLNPARFDAQELAYIENTLPPGGVFLDIGSNVGLYALVAAKALGSKGRVLTFEPNPEVLERLSFNVLSNASGPGSDLGAITIVAKAVTAENGPVSFARPANNLGEGHVVGAGSEAVDGQESVFSVDGTMLADCLAEQGVSAVDGMKIDIEGHELQALTPFFETAPVALMPGFVIIERGGEAHWRPLEALLKASGYQHHLSCHMNEIWTHV